MDAATLELIDRALAEDVGSGDVTTEATVAAQARARATIVQKAPGVIYGLEVAAGVFTRLDPEAAVERGPEGEWREAGARALAIEGSARALLTGERTALNFLGRLSGVATLTARVVRAVADAGGSARILDTRKTTPGLRALEKAAVAAGGGVNHRFGLWDAVLIKENHIAAAGGVTQVLKAAAAVAAQASFVEIEVETLAQLDQALAAGAKMILLDNMDLPALREAVRINDGRAVLEISGGVTLDSVRALAQTGVDRISIGALTKDVKATDFSMRLKEI
jgi:nicotinate-nucleotide pyrophosphorylase (carboxylating)